MIDQWIVKNNKNGKTIAHCGNINDAIMLVQFDPDNRSYHRYRLIEDQVITVNAIVDKQLNQQVVDDNNHTPKLDYHKNKLPEGQGIPINISL